MGLAAPNRMRRYHLSLGLLTIVAFLITGQFMRHHQPPLETFGDSTRLMFRSRHIYILASGLVNLMLGLYMQRRPEGWRRIVQGMGSVLLVISALLLVLAFLVEPQEASALKCGGAPPASMPFS